MEQMLINVVAVYSAEILILYGVLDIHSFNGLTQLRDFIPGIK